MSSSETITAAAHPGTASLTFGVLPPTCCVLAAVHSAPAQSHDVLNVATRLAKTANAPLTVLSVIETKLLPETHRTDHLAGIAAAVTTSLSSAVLDRVAAYVWDAVAEADVDYAPRGPYQHQCHVQVTIGDPDYEITSAVTAMNAATLVIGRGEVHGHGKVLNTLLNGIRSARVSRGTHVPVISVAPVVEGHDPLETIVIATDFSPASWAAAVTAVNAAPPGAHLYVVHVISDDSMTDPHKRDALQATLTAWSAPLASRLSAEATLSVSVLNGDAYIALKTYLPTVGATCIAMGGHRPRPNTVSVMGHTVPERLLATWPGSIILGPYHDPASA